MSMVTAAMATSLNAQFSPTTNSGQNQSCPQRGDRNAWHAAQNHPFTQRTAAQYGMALVCRSPHAVKLPQVGSAAVAKVALQAAAVLSRPVLPIETGTSRGSVRVRGARNAVARRVAPGCSGACAARAERYGGSR